jgi:SAM-dependent methyltransferase
MEKPRCDLCGAGDCEILYVGAGWQQPVPPDVALVRCQRCGLMYLSPRPDPEEIGNYYPSDYVPFRPAIEDEPWALMRWMRRRKLVQRRKLIERYSGLASGHILDVGCATGLFLNEMARAGWHTAGVEPTASAAEYAQTRLGLDVFRGTLEQARYTPESFDVVTFWDVLEHTFSPNATLAHSVRLLKPGGLVAINVPNWHSLDRRVFGAHWIGLDPPRHLYVFTRATLTALLERNGFCVLDWVCFMPSYFAFIVSLERALQERSPSWARSVSRALNVPGVRLVFEPWFMLSNWLRIGGVISVFARKQIKEMQRA